METTYRIHYQPREIYVSTEGLIIARFPFNRNLDTHDGDNQRVAEARARLFIRAMQMADAGAPIGEDLVLA